MIRAKVKPIIVSITDEKANREGRKVFLLFLGGLGTLCSSVFCLQRGTYSLKIREQKHR
jgi:hypothetical protein